DVALRFAGIVFAQRGGGKALAAEHGCEAGIAPVFTVRVLGFDEAGVQLGVVGFGGGGFRGREVGGGFGGLHGMVQAASCCSMVWRMICSSLMASLRDSISRCRAHAAWES